MIDVWEKCLQGTISVAGTIRGAFRPFCCYAGDAGAPIVLCPGFVGSASLDATVAPHHVMGAMAAPSMSPGCSRMPARLVAYFRMFTARETTSATVSNETTDCSVISDLAAGVNGMVSVGLNAVALVNDVYR